MLKINEIFYSIQGESTLAGLPTVFVRTSGCHLRCTYCDTKYAYYDGQKLSLAEIIKTIDNYSCKRVCITGGEPLLQPEAFELMNQLCEQNYSVSLETSGSISCENVNKRVKKVIDIKTPASGAENTFHFKNLNYITPKDEIKFVICNETDFDWAQNFAKENRLFELCNVLYSPSFGEANNQWLAEKMLHTKSQARLQLQLHKFIWPEATQGV